MGYSKGRIGWQVRGVLCLVALFFLAGAAAAEPPSPKNIVVILADGAAATQWDFGRYTSLVLRGKPLVATDFFAGSEMGLLRSEPHGVYVTDSAAAGSAMATGFKAENGALSVTPDGREPRTVMEAAKAAGKAVGLITTSVVYDATPSAFATHAKSRRDSQALVDKLLALEPEVLMGGGANYFLPQGAPGGKRKDGRDVIAAFRQKGWQVARDTAGLKAAAGPRVLGLFAEEDMEYEFERDPAKEPTLAEMTAAGLKALSQASPKGFVLLVESEHTDSAGHANDAAALMRSLWAVDEALAVALDFQRRHPDTLLIVTGDHETGGLSATYALKDPAVPGSRFYCGPAQVKLLGGIDISLTEAAKGLGKKPTAEALTALVEKHFPGFVLDEDLKGAILGGRLLERNHTYAVPNVLGRMVARQTGIYWGTSGHSAEPVLVGAVGPGAGYFRGFKDNTDFGKALHRLLGTP